MRGFKYQRNHKEPAHCQSMGWISFYVIFLNIIVNLQTMDAKGKNIIKYSLTSILAVILVWIAFRSLDWTVFLAGLRQTKWAFVILFTAASLLALVFRTLRWKALLNPIDPDAGRMLIWDANNVSNLANIALPGSGEFIRCGYLTSKKAPYQKVLGTVVMERFCDVLAIALLFIAALVLNRERFGNFFREQIWMPLSERLGLTLWIIIATMAIVATILIWAVFHFSGRNSFCSKVAGAVKGLWQGFLSFAAMDRKWLFLAYTAGIWLMYILMSYSIILAMPEMSGLSFMDALFISAVGNIASVIPVPGGIGAYHYLVTLCLASLYAATWETGILYATLCHELHAVIIIILGIISYIHLTLHRRK